MNHHSRNNNNHKNIHPLEQKNNQEPDNPNNYQQEIYNILVKRIQTRTKNTLQNR